MKHINNYVNVYVYIYVSKRGYLLGSQTASFIRPSTSVRVTRGKVNLFY
jgi:hypothetical protein